MHRLARNVKETEVHVWRLRSDSARIAGKTKRASFGSPKGEEHNKGAEAAGAPLPTHKSHRRAPSLARPAPLQGGSATGLRATFITARNLGGTTARLRWTW
jgi:hypothetical protein